jgi:hypothetical protein
MRIESYCINIRIVCLSCFGSVINRDFVQSGNGNRSSCPEHKQKNRNVGAEYTLIELSDTISFNLQLYKSYQREACLLQIQ